MSSKVSLQFFPFCVHIRAFTHCAQIVPVELDAQALLNSFWEGLYEEHLTDVEEDEDDGLPDIDLISNGVAASTTARPSSVPTSPTHKQKHKSTRKAKLAPLPSTLPRGPSTTPDGRKNKGKVVQKSQGPPRTARPRKPLPTISPASSARIISAATVSPFSSHDSTTTPPATLLPPHHPPTANTSQPDIPVVLGKRKNRSAESKKKKHLNWRAKRKTRRAQSNQIKESWLRALDKAVVLQVPHVDITTLQYAASGWRGSPRRLELVSQDKASIIAAGIQIYPWDGFITHPVVDANRRMFILLRAMDATPAGRARQSSMTSQLEKAAKDNKTHILGNGPFWSMRAGHTHGGGTWVSIYQQDPLLHSDQLPAGTNADLQRRPKPWHSIYVDGIV